MSNLSDNLKNSINYSEEEIIYKVKCKNGEKTIPVKFNKYLHFSMFFKSLLEDIDFNKKDINNVILYEITYLTVENLDLFIEFLSFVIFSDLKETNLLINDLVTMNENLETKRILPEMISLKIMKSLFLIQPNLELFYKDVLNLDNIVAYYELADYLRIPILEYLIMKQLLNFLKKSIVIEPSNTSKILKKEYVEKYYRVLFDQSENIEDEEIESILKS